MKRLLIAAALLLVAPAVVVPVVMCQQAPEGYRGFPVTHADASEVAAKLRTMLGGNSAKTDILVNRKENALYVKGPAESLQIASQVVTSLDRPIAKPAAPAAEAVVQAYTVAPQRLEQVAHELQRRFSVEEGVRISTDARTGQVLVVATPNVQQQIARELTGGQQPTAEIPGREYKLTNISWRDVENRLAQLWGNSIQLGTHVDGEITQVRLPQLTGDQVVLEVDRRNNMVTFHGADGIANYWKRIVHAMDTAQGRPQQTALMAMKKADPGTIQQAVSLMRQASLSQAQGQTMSAIKNRAPGQRPGDFVNMIFQPQAQDGQNNQNNNQANQTPPDDDATGDDPDGIPEAIGLIGDVRIEFIAELGIVIIRGHRRDVERVRQIIEQIQAAAAESQPIVEVFPLSHVNSESMANLVNPIYDEAFEPRLGPANIVALARPNSILLIGSKENLNTIKDLITKLDQPDTNATIRVFHLKHIPSGDLAAHIQAIYGDGTQQQQPQANQPTTLQTRVTVVSDYRSNSLVVQASPRDMLAIEDIIDELDVDKSPATMEVRIFPLKNALAPDLQQVLLDAIQGQNAAGQTQQPGGGQGQQGNQGAQGGRPSINVQVIRVDSRGNRILESGILAEVSIAADENTNSLVVTAPAKSMELIAALIDQLDTTPEAEAHIKVFEVRYGDATNLTVMLQELFGLQVTAGTQGALRQTFGSVFGAQGIQQQTAGESSLIPLRFTPEPRSNSIVASGSKEDLSVVEALLVRLDEDDLRARRTMVYRLNNAGAEAVATALQSILTSQQQLLQGQ
ncbi:MAG: secretin N-terminal domain-containing protein, partial [Pirellulaceae bacterium]|nr:secretin N-terminal domain-containing protein [Pirellulaceae bacterium]